MRFARAAEMLCGAPFRLHGRNPASGIDCVGLVACALAETRRAVPPIPHYGLRNADYGFVEQLAADAGFSPVSGELQPGDLLLARPGPAQRHLLIRLDRARNVHAHVGLGRVVIATDPLPWPLLRHWRLPPGPTRGE